MGSGSGSGSSSRPGAGSGSGSDLGFDLAWVQRGGLVDSKVD